LNGEAEWVSEYRSASLEVSQTLIGKILAPSSFLLLFPDVSAGRNARELWWTGQELFPAGIITTTTTTMALHAHISPGG
jgi:hypothetical protein